MQLKKKKLEQEKENYESAFLCDNRLPEVMFNNTHKNKL